MFFYIGFLFHMEAESVSPSGCGVAKFHCVWMNSSTNLVCACYLWAFPLLDFPALFDVFYMLTNCRRLVNSSFFLCFAVPSRYVTKFRTPSKIHCLKGSILSWTLLESSILNCSAKSLFKVFFDVFGLIFSKLDTIGKYYNQPSHYEAKLTHSISW